MVWIVVVAEVAVVVMASWRGVIHSDDDKGCGSNKRCRDRKWYWRRKYAIVGQS